VKLPTLDGTLASRDFAGEDISWWIGVDIEKNGFDFDGCGVERDKSSAEE